MTKSFVLDTNVLLHNAECIHSFADNTVILPMAVIEELDKFKGNSDELGRNARRVIRDLDGLRSKGNLRDGVPMSNEGTLKILSCPSGSENLGLEDDIADNRILRLAYALFKQGESIIFVSKDINARIKADALGLQAEDFERQKINFDEFYSGHSEVEIPSKDMDIFLETRILKNGNLGPHPNAFVTLKDKSKPERTALARVTTPGRVEALPSKHERIWSIRAKNREQRMALELLMDPKVQIVTLVGQAGTGKTLLALAAGLQETAQNHRYDRILVSRPIIPMGKDIGFLPGGKGEKLSHWMEPIFDNLIYLLRDGIEDTPKKKKSRLSPQEKVNKLLRDNTIVLEALTYIRGRSIPGQYVIVDEAQNLTPHEVKTIVSRAGEGSKMVLTGDPYQIDNPYLDPSSNGLTYAAERMKGQPLHGHVTLKKSERSALAAVAAELL